MRCDFCGREFDLDQCSPGCDGCPMQSGCGGVTCPYCGYTNVREGALVRWLRSVFSRKSEDVSSGRERQ